MVSYFESINLHEVKKQKERFLDRDVFNNEFEKVLAENDESLHSLSAALSKQSSIHSVTLPHSLEAFVGCV